MSLIGVILLSGIVAKNAILLIDFAKWAREREYGLRWNGTEGIFSAVKRKFGEKTRSHKIENALSEVKRKFWAYDTMKAYAERPA